MLVELKQDILKMTAERTIILLLLIRRSVRLPRASLGLALASSVNFFFLITEMSYLGVKNAMPGYSADDRDEVSRESVSDQQRSGHNCRDDSYDDLVDSSYALFFDISKHC